MAPPIEKEYIPLLATIIGGLLATAGGYISNHFLNKKSIRRESREVKRGKLEEVYELTIRYEDWATKSFLEIIIDNIEAPAKPINEIIMVINLYFPELKGQMQEFMEADDKFKRHLSNFWNARGEYFGEVNPDWDGANETKKIQEEYILVTDSLNSFKLNITKQFQHYF
jgi:hypothetical protein